MREILFRGKRVDNGEWVEGGYYLEPYTDYVYIVCWNSFGMGFTEYIKVDPATVGQYTGLQDKNGKRIFEGDIVRGRNILHEHRIKYETAFDDGLFCMVDDHGVGWHHSHIDDKVIVGNIHDNPELLMEVQDD